MRLTHVSSDKTAAKPETLSDHKMMYTQVNKKLCIGCGLCRIACPAWFELDSAGAAYTESTPVPQQLRDACQVAADTCPINAISVRKE